MCIKSCCKKIVSSLMVLLLIALTAAGCAKQDPGKNTAGTADPTVTQAPEGPKPALRFLAQYIKEDPNNRHEAAVIEELTGYKVTYEMLPQDKPADKLSIIIASGEEYDVITTLGSMKEYMFEFARKGALVELEPLIDKYGPRLKQVIPQKSYDLFKVNNKTYFIPSKLPLEYINNGLLIRQDWLDKVGMKEPKTLDEFVAVLRAFKEKDPGNKGAENIPLCISSPSSLHGVLGAFGIANDWNVVDGKIVAREELPGFKAYLEFMASLYKEGLIDKEMPVNKGTTITEKFGSGRAGMIVQNAFSVGPVVDALTKSVPDAKYKYIEPVVGDNGQQGVQQNCGYDYLTYIPKASKHQEDAMKWINLKLQQDTFRATTIGQEGVHHNYKDGVYSAILPKFNEDFGYGYYFLTGTDEQAYAKYWMARLQRDMRNYDCFVELQKGVGKYSKLDVIKLATDVPTFTKNELTLSQMTSDFMVKVVAGAEPISAIDEYVNKWKKAGGDDSTKEINEWYKKYQQIAK